MAETAGWSVDSLRATVGVPLHLRLTSDDVVHGFAVGQLDTPGVDVLPGKVTDLTLLFDRPGTYTFYCTRWCGLNHWRMRGTIEVEGDRRPSRQESGQPLYAELGLDLDAPRSAAARSGWHARGCSCDPPARVAACELSVHGLLSRHSPVETWQELRADPAFSAFEDAELWAAHGLDLAIQHNSGGSCRRGAALCAELRSLSRRSAAAAMASSQTTCRWPAPMPCRLE